MRINVYSQELTDEVVRVEKVSNTGRPYVAAQLILHSSPMLHHPPQDDDRSAVTFWLPSSASRLESMAQAFEHIAAIFRGAQAEARTQAPGGDAPYELDDLDRQLLEVCREGVEYLNDGSPLKDAMDQDEIEDAIRLLVSMASPSAPSSPPLSGWTNGPGRNGGPGGCDPGVTP